MTGGEMVLRVLREQGVSVGFGIPGALNAHLYDALHHAEPGFRHVLVRHELGGAWMADGFARASNDVGVAFTVPGPGATHAASAVAGAYTDCSRLLLVSSQSESKLRGEFRRDLFHGLDQQRLFAPITKWSAAVRHAGEIAEVLAEAFHHLRRGRPGPVQVEIPADVLGAEGGTPRAQARIQPPALRPAPRKVADAVTLLRQAQRPLIFAGDGILHAGASDALGELATALRAPVVTTVMGKGALREDHPWSLGDSNSAAGSAAWGEHDLILALGVRFVQVDTRWPWFTAPQRLVHVDADARELNRVYPADVALAGDPDATLLGLLTSALQANPGERSGWDARFPMLKAQSDARQVDPLLGALREALPKDALISFDVCVPGFQSRKDWFSYAPHGYYYPGVYVGMGFGLPAGIGAKMARPEHPVCIVAGDGGFQMTMAELGTAAQQRLPLVVVVVNDGGLTLIRRVQDREFGRRCEVDLVNPDFVALAAAYGIPAERAHSPAGVQEAVARAVARGTLSFVEYAVEAR